MDEQLLALIFPPVVPFWALMILAPRWSITQRVISSPLIAAAPALIYAVGVVPRFGEITAIVMSNDLATIAAFLGTPSGAVIAWAHFIALDLMLGRWIYLDSRTRRVHALIVSPILVLTILLAPLGLLTYLVARIVPTSRATRDKPELEQLHGKATTSHH